jgi:oligoribonuclease NrnB/cAMP/cGMP phosphodiesterase (DHH superfamily)
VTKNIVFYHDKCTDGFGAAFAAYLKLGQEAIYIPVNYKPIQDMEPLEALEYAFKDTGITAQDYASLRIFVVDYSFPVDQYKVHRKLFKQIVIIDHHKSAIDSYLPYIKQELFDDDHILEDGHIAYSTYRKGNTMVLFSSVKSGALLSYICFGSSKIPLAFELISDRDIWTFKYGDQARALHLYLETLKPWTFEKWQSILSDEKTREMVSTGLTLLEERNKLLKSYADNAQPIDIEIGQTKLRGAAVSAPMQYASGVGELIYNAGHDYAVIYSLTDWGYSCSLRSKGDYDVCSIAEYFGGGGHLNAAGCTISKDLFEKFLLCSE